MLPPISERIAAQLGARVATPGEIDAAINGQPQERFPDTSPHSEIVFDESHPGSPTPDYRSLGRGRTNRRTQRLHAQQGGRSPQNQGNCHSKSGGYGRR